MKDLNIAFFGTPELAVFALEEMAAAGLVPGLLVTTTDKPVGRKLIPTPPPTKLWAETHDVPTLQVNSLKTPENAPELANSEWDLFIVAAYNVILPKWVLELPKHGTLNIHPSLLPKLRGPSPVRSAILQDEKESVGVTIIKLDEQVDHGPILAQAHVQLDEWPLSGRMLDEILFREGGRLLNEVVPAWVNDDFTPEEQNHSEATFTHKFAKGEGELNLADDGRTNYLKYCAYDGWPGTFFFDKNGARIKVASATFENNAFTIEQVIPEGKKVMTYADFTRQSV